jgi:hypothetical protein
MRRRPTGWTLAYRAHAIVFPFDVVLLALAVGLGIAGRGGGMQRGISTHALIGGAAALASLTRAVSARWLICDGRNSLLLTSERASRNGWELARASRDLGRVTSLSVPVTVLLFLAAATGVTPGWAVVHRWTASFAVGSAAIGSPLIGLVIWARVRRVAASEASRVALTGESDSAAAPPDSKSER